jgi:energy-coupling factor transport system permease protein
MDEFEFQRFITIGQYMPTGSPIHRLDPRVRLVAGLLLLGTATLAPDPLGLGVLLGGLLGLLLLARIPLDYALRALLPPLPFVLLLVVLQTLLSNPPPTSSVLLALGPVHITVVELREGGIFLLRFAALFLSISLTSFCISTREIIHALAALLRPLARLGLPADDFVLMVQVTLRFLPLLAQEAERIAKAQASRGAEWGTGRAGLIRRVRRTLPLLVPLFLTSLQRAENLALAMEARCYDGRRRRTSLVVLHFQIVDGVAFLLIVSFCLLIFIL